MIIYCAGYKVRAEIIELYRVEHVERIVAARSLLIRAIVAQGVYTDDILDRLEHAHAVSSVGVYFEGDVSRQISANIAVLHELLAEAAVHAKGFHWSDIADVETGNFRQVHAMDAGQRHVHDGSAFLTVREGVTGPRPKVRIAAIDMIEY